MPHTEPLTLDVVAERLLDVATTALPDVSRAYIAGGPTWAKDCEQIVVNLNIARTFSPRAQQIGRIPGGDCVRMRTPVLSVTYVRDCYPTADLTDAGTPILPAITEITAWSTEFYRRVDALWRALIDAGSADLFGDCSAVTFTDAVVTGPQGGAVWVEWPITVGLTGEAGPAVFGP